MLAQQSHCSEPDRLLGEPETREGALQSLRVPSPGAVGLQHPRPGPWDGAPGRTQADLHMPVHSSMIDKRWKQLVPIHEPWALQARATTHVPAGWACVLASLTDWASLELSPSVESCGCGLGPCLQCRDPGSILGLGRSPGEGNGNPLQYPCLENSMDGGACQATVYGVAKRVGPDWAAA